MSPRDRLKEIERLRTEGVLTLARYHEERSNLIDELAPPRWVSWRASIIGFGFGCFTLIAIPVILVIGLIATFGSRVSDDTRVAEDRDVHVRLSEQSRASVESWNRTVNHVTILGISDPALPTSAPPPVGFRFVEVTARVERVRTSEDTDRTTAGGDFASSFQLHASIPALDGSTPASDSSRYGNAAVSMDVTLTFTVLAGASVDWLRFNPTLLAHSIYFEATE